MGLRINTNIDAQYALANLTNTNNKLSQSLNRLSTGLRITSAADDAAGMTIADGLKFQSTNLGQAIANGNNGVNLIQIADMALQKSIDIVGQISQKAVQAANDTEDDNSRGALQSDINKLLDEIDNISSTTSYKGTKLLDGSFVNKFLQVGAYADQTLSLGITKTASTVIGKTASASGDDAHYSDSLTGAAIKFDGTHNLITAGQLIINGIDVNNYIDGSASTSQLDAKQMAAAINQVQDATGVTATAVNTLTASAALQTTTINDGDLKINGVDIGATNNGNLVADINKFSDQTGVTAAINDDNELVLTAADGRNIAVETTSAVTNAIHIADTATTTNLSALGVTNGTTAGNFASTGTIYINGDSYKIAASGATVSGAYSTLTSLAGAINANTATTGITAKDADNTMANFTLTINDGNDLNATTTSIAGATAKLINNSNHGAISLTSDDTIAIGGDTAAIGGFSAGSHTPTGSLSDVDVTSQSGAESAITTAKSALKNLDSIRSGLGSVQNQIKATVENITTTQININSAESSIRDVNFAKESSNFSKLQILAQSGTYALAQSNAVQQNVLRLLQ